MFVYVALPTVTLTAILDDDTTCRCVSMPYLSPCFHLGAFEKLIS